MSPHQKFQQLIDEYSYSEVLKIIDHMITYYIGIDSPLKVFWAQVGDEAERYNLINLTR